MVRRGKSQEHLEHVYKDQNFDAEDFAFVAEVNIAVCEVELVQTFRRTQFRLCMAARALKTRLENEDVESVCDFLQQISRIESNELLGTIFPSVDEISKELLIEITEATTLIPFILVHRNDRDKMIGMLKDTITEHHDRHEEVLLCAFIMPEGGALVNSLEKYDLLKIPRRMQRGRQMVVENVDALKWLASKGRDVVRSDICMTFQTPVVEWLLQNGLSLKMLLEGLRNCETFVDLEMMKVILRQISWEEIVEHLPLDMVWWDIETVELMKNHGFVFDEQRASNIDFSGKEEQLYALLYCNVLKYDKLDMAKRGQLRRHIRNNDVKISKHTLHLMKPVRKKKMITFIMCVRRVCGQNFPKDLILTILDNCFSPTIVKTQIKTVQMFMQ